MATQKKIDTVTELTDKMAKAKVIVVTDYRGLKHKQLETLRKSLKTTKGELMVAKNTLIMRALGDKGPELKESLKDASAVLFSYADEVTPLKEMLKFFKTAGVGKTRGGLMGTVVMTDTEVSKLASLPSRDILLGTLVRQLNAPIQGLHYALSWNINKLVWALNAVKEKKG
jgi:large subunit ribosomal protein L10